MAQWVKDAKDQNMTSKYKKKSIKKGAVIIN